MPDLIRERALAGRLIEHFGLDLEGLTVLTEAASGPYLPTPLIAALAGARVIAATRDSRYATAAEVRRATEAAAEQWGVAVEVTEEPDAAGADIVTNSGFVRPIDAALIATMKPTAVVPLMWETWEFRPGDVDLDACRARGILVLGTCESRPPCDLVGYSAHIALKLLYELGLEGFRTRVLLLGGQPTLGAAMAADLPKLGAEVTWVASYDRPPPAGDHDAVLIAEHADPRLLLGPGGFLDPAELHPATRVGVIAGNVDADALERSGLRYAPKRIAPHGHMSYQASELGPRAVLELYTAGLKVGEAMARARLAGASLDEATRRALKTSPAMEFAA
jgi:hypothetical protein